MVRFEPVIRKIGGKYNTSLPTLTDGDDAILRTDSSGRLIVSPAGGGVTANLQLGSPLDATETVIGAEVDVSNYTRMITWLDYTKGDETGVYLIPKFLTETGGGEHQFMEWSTGSEAVKTARKFYLTATGSSYVVLDVQATNIIKWYDDANGGTPTGSLSVRYTLS